MKIKPIKTRSFSLRTYRLSDAARLAALLNNRNIIRWMSAIYYPYEISIAKKFLNIVIKECRKKRPEKINLAIVVNDEQAGSIGMEKIKYGHKAAFGYWLGQSYWGQGIMTGVIREFSRFAFREFKLKRLEAKTFLGNRASERVLEKNGFLCEGVIRKFFKKQSRYYDCKLWAKVKG